MREDPMSITASALAPQMCVLLIGYTEDTMLLVQSALQEYGQGKYRLEYAEHMSEGLERIQNDRVDIVLLDIGSPGSSGPERYIWIRVTAPRLPILILSSNLGDSTERALSTLGANDFLMKDLLTGPELVNAIQAALSRKKQTNRKSW
jgi:DNA-binding NarL/FixJ family response regulator